jgi:putative transposase
MARLPGVVVIDVPHRVTQRDNARQVILPTDTERVTYLALLREYSRLYCLSPPGYCLMSNHVHLIVNPHAPDTLSRCLQHVHRRYAQYWNARPSSTGHVWQGRDFVPVRWTTCICGRPALCRVETSSCGDGDNARTMEVI